MYHALPNDMVMLCYTGSAVPFPSQLSQLLSWSSRGLDGWSVGPPSVRPSSYLEDTSAEMRLNARARGTG